MSTHGIIDDLNKLSKDIYKTQEKTGFFAHLTKTYPVSKEIEGLVKSMAGLKEEDGDWDDSDVAKMQLPSIIALMSIPTKMTEKLTLLNLTRRWLEITDADESRLAIVLQALRVSDLNFNEVYAIRTSIFNYFTRPHINTVTTLKILKNGKFEVQPRDMEQFDGDIIKEHYYILNKLRKLVTNRQQTAFIAINQYDYRTPILDERSHQITRPLSSYKVSGYKDACFAKDFGKVRISNPDESEEIMSHDHYSALENYRSSVRFFKKLEKRNLDSQFGSHCDTSSEDSEEEDYDWLRNSMESVAASERDSGVDSFSESFDLSTPPSPIKTCSAFHLPTTATVQPDRPL